MKSLQAALTLFLGFPLFHCLAQVENNLEIESISAVASSSVLLETAQKGGSNWRWFYYPELVGSGDRLRRDIGVIFEPRETTEINFFALKVADIKPSAGGDAKSAIVSLKINEFTEPQTVGPSVLQAKGALPSEIIVNDYLAMQFRSVTLKAGTTYLVMLSFTEPSPSRWIQVANTKSQEGVTGVIRTASDPEMKDLAIEPRSSGVIVFQIGNK